MSSTGAPSSTIMATRTPLEGELISHRDVERGQRRLEVVHFEGDVRHRPDELGDLAVRVEAHPLDAERARLEARDVDLEMGQIDLARVGHRGRNAKMMVAPAAFGDGGWRFVALPFLPHDGLSSRARMIAPAARPGQGSIVDPFRESP